MTSLSLWFVMTPPDDAPLTKSFDFGVGEPEILLAGVSTHLPSKAIDGGCGDRPPPSRFGDFMTLPPIA